MDSYYPISARKITNDTTNQGSLSLMVVRQSVKIMVRTSQLLVSHKGKFLISILLLIIGTSFHAFGTHNRAGEITFKHIQGNRYEAKLVTYTDPTSPPDREYLLFHWGDNTLDTVQRSDINRNVGDVGSSQHPVQKNVYKARHTYNGPDKYTIRMRDQNRVDNIKNIESSVQTAFYVETQLQVFSGGRFKNNSPVLLQPPIDRAQKGEVFVHYPNGYDPDDDSLVYSLTTPKKAFGEKVNGYYDPVGTNDFNLDSVTGRLEWDVPDTAGIYNIAIKVEEFRDGRKMGEVIRDMQIIVEKNDPKNRKPILDSIPDTCVKAGTNFTLKTPVRAVDTTPDQTDNPPHIVTLTATGGPFEVSETPAEFPSNPAPSSRGTVSAEFSWDISCNHIRKNPYRVVFKAKDDHRETPLADLKHMDIKVIGPEPENLTADPQPQGIQLDWDLPACENVKGYNVYRRVDTSFWEPDHCENGIPGYTGFKKIKRITNTEETSFFDQTAAPGAVYCYRITGIYRNEGNAHLVEGYASNEACAKLQKDIPVITHVDVLSTDQEEGTIFLDWSKPIELDSSTYDPPYKYEIHHSSSMNNGGGELVHTRDSIESFQALVSDKADTSYVDSGLNTRDNPHSYEIQFYGSDPEGNEVKIGSSRNSSSVFLNISPDHKALDLSWEANVLWDNQKYVVFRFNPAEDTFKVQDTVTDNTYSDTNLVKDSTYCYYVQSIGSFSANGFPDPIINNSQISCDEPIDTIAPCTPELSVNPFCQGSEGTDLSNRPKENRLDWIYEKTCLGPEVAGFYIYHRNHRGKNFTQIDEIPDSTVRNYDDTREVLEESVAGCYAVQAYDSYGNVSELSNNVCVDNCPKYELPNVFTPNGDRKNDVFKPKPGWQFVDRVNFKVFNRWGDLVFKTSDPMLRWAGTDYQSGKELSSGTYYYEIEIFENRLEGTESRTQKGVIQLIR